VRFKPKIGSAYEHSPHFNHHIIGKGCIYYVGIQYVTIYNVVQVNSMVNHWSYRLHREGNDYGLHIKTDSMQIVGTKYKADMIIISSKISCSFHDIAKKNNLTWC
jgi:hypothetical protein